MSFTYSGARFGLVSSLQLLDPPFSSTLYCYPLLVESTPITWDFHGLYLDLCSLESIVHLASLGGIGILALPKLFSTRTLILYPRSG